MVALSDAGDPLPGSVKLYGRHLFVCTGKTGWPARIDEDGGYLAALSAAIAARGPDMPRRVKLTACDEAGQSPGGYDLLVFPDAVRYLGVQTADFPALIEDHLVGGRVSDRIPHRPAPGQYVFVCVHGERDARCGACGPPLVEGFRAELAARGLEDRVSVRRTSHVGGHKYAGNVLIYPGGDWYGYVAPADIPRVVERHIAAGQIVWDLWRGRMGLTPEEQIRISQAFQK